MLQILQSIAPIASGFGAAAVLLSLLKWILEIWRWRNFKKLAGQWIDDLLSSGNTGTPSDDEEWAVLCEKLLSDSLFTPTQCHQLLSTAVVVFKGIAAEHFVHSFHGRSPR